MTYWQRHLPHWIPEDTAIFVTWRLAGTLPPSVPASTWLEKDAALDRTKDGPRTLAQPEVAQIVAEALLYGEVKGKYRLHAWVVMSNHVHMVMTPKTPFSETMRWLKWTTARRSNRLLGRRGIKFWQDESYDHAIRTTDELRKTVLYVEMNPVTAGLVERADQWLWSSARKTGDKIACPTTATHGNSGGS